MKQETVECKWCGEQTDATALKECAGCWELRSRMERNMPLVRLIWVTLNNDEIVKEVQSGD